MKYIYLNGLIKYFDDKCLWVFWVFGFFGKYDYDNNDWDNCYN